MRFVNQPARDLLGDELVELLRSPETSRFWAASAWVRRPALRRLEPALAAFAKRVKPGDCRGLFGVDLGGTTREGLELATALFGQARVFHSSGSPVRTFHPKLYLFAQSDTAVVVVGSSNFTTGGLWGNFEAATVLELDLGEASDAALLADVEDWYRKCWSDRDGTLAVNPKTIDALVADPSIRLPREHEVRKVFAGTRVDRRTGVSAFPTKIKGLRRIPKAPPSVDEGLERGEERPAFVPGIPLEDIETPKREDDLRVLLAGIPSDRWKQVGFNRDVTEDFFHVYVKGDPVWIEGVSQTGLVGAPRQSGLILSKSNQNHRIEFPEPDGRGDPKPKRATLVVLERSFRTFRYMSLRAGDAGYREVERARAARPGLGVSRKTETKRVVLNYGDLKALWPGSCPLR